MDAEQLLGTLIRGALGGRRKRSTGALRFLTDGRHSLLNAGTLLTAAGVAWGLYETATRTQTPPASAGTGVGSAPPGGAHAARVDVPPLPAVGAAGGAALSPLPAASEVTGADAVSAASVSPEVLRVIRLTIAAARADGTLTPKEEAAILTHARTAGAESLVEQELRAPTPLPALIAGAPPAQRDDLYTLAFAVARADETVSGGERIFLAQLAHLLGLDAAAATELERVAVERIAGGAS
jgi:uncharacterized membrane protein YebE (DUF533 family)